MNELSPRREFAIAQSGMYSRFCDGTFSLADEKAKGGVEAEIADKIGILCANTFTILTKIADVNSNTITPILDGGSVRLEGYDRMALLYQLARVYDTENFAEHRLKTEYKESFLDSWNHLVEVADIQIHGSVIRIEIDSKARECLELLHSKTFAGMATMIQLESPPEASAQDMLEMYGTMPVQFLYIDREQAELLHQKGDKSEPQDIDLHEWQHIIDIARSDILFHTDRNRVMSEEMSPIHRRIIRVLSRELFDPQSAAETLNYLASIEREYIEGDIPKFEFTPSYIEQCLLKMQLETCANIAGRIADGHVQIRYHDGQSHIAEKIAVAYLPFGSDSFISLLKDISLDAEVGDFVFYKGHDRILVEWLDKLNLRISTYEKRQQWANFFIGVYLDPRGEIAQMRTAAKNLIARALYAFRDLEHLRRGAQVALAEVSDIPISEWPRYVQEQRKLEEKNAS